MIHEEVLKIWANENAAWLRAFGITIEVNEHNGIPRLKPMTHQIFVTNTQTKIFQHIELKVQQGFNEDMFDHLVRKSIIDLMNYVRKDFQHQYSKINHGK